MSLPEPLPFAKRWIDAWNARDLDRVLRDYADAVVFTSPTARRFVPESGGTIVGKDPLRRYWETALAAHPALHFELRAVYAGIDTVVIDHEDRGSGLRVSEALTFADGLVVRGHAAHAVPISG